MPELNSRKFRIIKDKYEGRYNFGINFAIDWKDVNGKRDIYLFIQLGKFAIGIGMITKYEETEYED